MSTKDLSTSQVAERFSVTAANVRLWCQRGLLPNAYVRKESRGDVWMIPERDLKGFEPPKKTGRPRKAETQTPTRNSSRKKLEAKP
jgi:1,2-phenylacetyl-CoA epoxidase PaaB subunit